MSKQLARTVVNGFNMQPALLSLTHANGLHDLIRSMAEADDAEENRESVKRTNHLAAAYGYQPGEDSKPFAFAGGLAFIPISGLLINRFSASWGWVTGYNAIRNQLNAALADDEVDGIVFDVDSGGGMVAGCFELANDIYESRKVKPSCAIIDANCYSAAYALASSASRMVITPSGGAGSIGVVAMHVDYSQMLKDAGIKVTFIHAGDHKVDGNPYQSLPASVKADIQKSVDMNYEEFVSLVAHNRGLDPDVVRGTEARCFSAAEALDLGLVDAIATPKEGVSAFFNELSRSVTTKETSMSTAAEKPGAESATAPENKPAETVTPVDANAERKAERERIAAITGNEAAVGRSKLANHLALNTDMSAEEAIAVLSAAAVEKDEKPAAAANPFAAAMDGSPNPEVGADGDGSTELTAAQQILQAQALATGVKH